MLIWELLFEGTAEVDRPAGEWVLAELKYEIERLEICDVNVLRALLETLLFSKAYSERLFRGLGKKCTYN